MGYAFWVWEGWWWDQAIGVTWHMVSLFVCHLIAYGQRCGVIACGHLLIACNIITLAWSWRSQILSRLCHSDGAHLCHRKLHLPLFLDIVNGWIFQNPSIGSMVPSDVHSMCCCIWLESHHFIHCFFAYLSFVHVYVRQSWAVVKKIPAVYVSINRFPFACATKPFVEDSKESTDTHSPGVSGLMFFAGRLPLQDFYVAFLYIQLAHIRLLSLGVLSLKVSWFVGSSVEEIVGGMEPPYSIECIAVPWCVSLHFNPPTWISMILSMLYTPLDPFTWILNLVILPTKSLMKLAI